MNMVLKKVKKSPCFADKIIEELIMQMDLQQAEQGGKQL